MRGASAVWSSGRRTRTAAAAEASEQVSARTGEHGAVERVVPGGAPSNDPAPALANGRRRGGAPLQPPVPSSRRALKNWRVRSEEHTSELQSRENLVCRLLLEKKKTPGKGDLRSTNCPRSHKSDGSTRHP